MALAFSYTMILVYPDGGVSPMLMSVADETTAATPMATPDAVVFAPLAVASASPVVVPVPDPL